MKNGKILVSLGIGLIIFIVIIYLVTKNSSQPNNTPNGTNNTPNGTNNIFTSNPFQTLLTGTNTSLQNLFNANATSGAYNISLPSYINGGSTINSSNPNAPTLDLTALPKGCSIDNYLYGTC